MPRSPDDDRPPESPTLSERLKQRFGLDVDPRIDLPADSGRPAPEPGSSALSWPSSGVIRRMSERRAASGRYRMEGEIARGGMGAILEVFDEDLRRKLAMKVIVDHAQDATASARGSVHPQKLARFLEEAQVTGQLDHPGIVPVHELGLDADGRVYFTMRLVRGRDLAAIFHLVDGQKEGWTVTRALGVLLKVCEATAFAHAKGVVHRDLKPANVMVGQFGEVYVMDWGLARVRDHADRHDLRVRRDAGPAPAPVEIDRREESGSAPRDELYTMDGDIVGTPSYMAPEQALGQLEKLDARSDVYALGAMLYRLLAGTAPHTSKDEFAGAGTILERVIAGPPKPLETLAPEAPAELVAICEKAMERDPSRRYPDMLAVAEDLRAFLEGRVVGAFETGALAEARKWIRRNTPLAASLAASVLALAGGLAASLVFARAASASAELAEVRRKESDANALLAEKRRGEADANAAAAQRQARVATEVNQFLNQDLLASVAPEEQGIDVTVREVLEEASTRLEGRFADEPLVEAALRRTIGVAFGRLGEHETARVHLERAVELSRAHEGELADATIDAQFSLAEAWSDLGRFDEALALFERVVATSAEARGEDHPGTLAGRNGWGNTLRRAGRMDEARALLEETVEASTGVLGPDHQQTLSARNDLALLELEAGRFDEARRELEEILGRLRASVGPRDRATLNASSILADAEMQAGDFAAAAARSQENVALRREVLGPDHPETGQDIGNLGTYLARLGRLEEALDLFRESLRIARLQYGEDHPRTLMARGNLATTYSRLGREAESVPLQLEVLEGRRRVLGPRHPDTLLAMSVLATSYVALDRFEEAEALYRETLALQDEVLGPDHPQRIVTLENLSRLLFLRDDLGGSEELLREVLEARKRVLGERHPDVAKSTLNLAVLTRRRGDAPGARALCEDALARGRAAGPGGDEVVVMCLRELGDLQAQAQENEEAVRSYEEALEIQGRLSSGGAVKGYLLHQISTAKFASGDFPGALASAREAVAVREAAGGPDDRATLISLYNVLRSLVALERFADAEPVALDFHERALRSVGPDHDFTQRARRLLADVYEGLSKPEEAARWR